MGSSVSRSLKFVEKKRKNRKESFEKDLIVTEDVKSKDDQDNITNGPSKLIEELKSNKDWEIFNFFNNGIFKTKPSSTGLTILQRCRK